MSNDQKIAVDVFGTKDADVPAMARFGEGSTTVEQVQRDLDKAEALRSEQQTQTSDVRRA